MKAVKLRVVFATLIAVLAVAVCSVFAVKGMPVLAASEDTVRENIYIGNIYVGGMTRAEVTRAMEDYVGKLSDTQIILNGTNGKLVTSAEEIGLSWDEAGIIDRAMNLGSTGNLIQRFKEVAGLQYQSLDLPVGYKVDLAMARFVLEEHEDELIDATVDWGLERVDGEFVVIPGKDGTKINVQASIDSLIDYLNNEWEGGAINIDLVTEVASPQGSAEQLAMVKDVLGTFETNFKTSDSSRHNNVVNGASKIDGYVLYPGETFSVYETISPMTEENGYMVGHGYEQGQVVDTVGGGICQVSTTLYNAVLLSELPIEDRSAHSMLVDYVEPSMDAAIAGDYKDMKFGNNTDAPIYIEANWANSILTFTIYGHETREETHKVSFESEVLSTEPAGLTVNVDENQPVGVVTQQQSAYPATVARLWKITTENGVETERKVINNSKYISSNKVITVGTATNDPAIKEAVMAAIATNNETTIMTTVRSYAGALTGNYANTKTGRIYNSGSTPEAQAAAAAAAAAAANPEAQATDPAAQAADSAATTESAQ